MSNTLAHKVAFALPRNKLKMSTNPICTKGHRLHAVNHKQDEVCNQGAHQLLTDQ